MKASTTILVIGVVLFTGCGPQAETQRPGEAVKGKVDSEAKEQPTVKGPDEKAKPAEPTKDKPKQEERSKVPAAKEEKTTVPGSGAVSPSSATDAIKAAIADLKARKAKADGKEEQDKLQAAIDSLEKVLHPPMTPAKAKADAKEKETVPVDNVKELLPGSIYTGQLKVGQRGPIKVHHSIDGFRNDYWLEVDEVLSEKEVLIRYVGSPRSGLTRVIKFLVEMPTKGLADDAIINLEGKLMEVVGRKKITGSTVFVFRSVPEKSDK